MTRDNLLEYVAGLEYELRTIYELADRFMISTNDTLDDSFQLAANVVELFEKKTKKE